MIPETDSHRFETGTTLLNERFDRTCNMFYLTTVTGMLSELDLRLRATGLWDKNTG